MSDTVSLEPVWPVLVEYLKAQSEREVETELRALAIMPGAGGLRAVDAAGWVYKRDLGSDKWEACWDEWDDIVAEAFIVSKEA